MSGKKHFPFQGWSGSSSAVSTVFFSTISKSFPVLLDALEVESSDSSFSALSFFFLPTVPLSESSLSAFSSSSSSSSSDSSSSESFAFFFLPRMDSPKKSYQMLYLIVLHNNC